MCSDSCDSCSDLRSLWVSGMKSTGEAPGWSLHLKKPNKESRPQQGWPCPGPCLPCPVPGAPGGPRAALDRGLGTHRAQCVCQEPCKAAVSWQSPQGPAEQGRQQESAQHSAWHEFWSAEELNGFRLRLISLSWSKTEAGLLEFLLLLCHYTAESQELSNDMNNICPYLIQPAADNCLSPFPSVHELLQRGWSDHTEFRQICSCRTMLQIRTSPCLKWRKRGDSSKHKKLRR